MPGVFLKKPKGFGRDETQQVVGGRLCCGRPIVVGGSHLDRTDLRDFGRCLGSGKNFFDSGSVCLVMGAFSLQVHACGCMCSLLLSCSGCLRVPFTWYKIHVSCRHSLAFMELGHIFGWSLSHSLPLMLPRERNIIIFRNLKKLMFVMLGMDSDKTKK